MVSINFVFPPLTSINYPYLSTASLKAWVNAESDHEASQTDLNVRVVRKLLSTDQIAHARHRAEAALTRARQPDCPPAEAAWLYTRATDFQAKQDVLEALLPDAISTVRSRAAISDPAEMRIAERVIRDVLDTATIDQPFERRDLRESVFSVSTGNPDALRRRLSKPDPEIDGWFDDLILDDDLQEDVLGISLVYRNQVYPTLRLAAWLRRHRPRGKVVVGGPIFTLHRERLPDQAWLFDLFDGIALFEGEQPVVDYLDRIKAGEDASGLSGWACLSKGEVVVGSPPAAIAAERFPTPDFDGLPLDDYLLPERTLPLLASRGCYWRCAFCTHHHIYGDSYRGRTADAIREDIRKLCDRHGVKHFYFVDESMSPSLLRKVSSALLPRDDIRWGCEMRLEKSVSSDDLKAAFQSGCRVFSFGMESANPRVLNAMNKGVDAAQMSRVISDTHDAGIHAHVMCIVGFPSESEEEANETLAFVDAHQDRIDLLGWSFFCLHRNSPVEAEPQKFGAKIIGDIAEGEVFEERMAYEVECGLDRASAFDLWSEYVQSSTSRAIFQKTGHAERERFLFSTCTESKDASGDQLTGLLSRHVADLEAVPLAHEVDIAQLRIWLSTVFLRAGRAFNVDGVSLSQFRAWENERMLLRPKDCVSIFDPKSWNHHTMSHPEFENLLNNTQIHRNSPYNDQAGEYEEPEVAGS